MPFGAGATPDIVARLLADYLHDRLQQTFIVENKPGASGNTGTDAVAKSEPDGATLGISIGGPLAINTLLFAQSALRSEEGSGARHAAHVAAERARGQFKPRRDDTARADRSHQAQSRQIRLRLDRHRFAVASRHGGDRAEERHQAGACPLLVIAAGHDGADPQ